MNQFMGRRNQIEFSIRFKAVVTSYGHERS